MDNILAHTRRGRLFSRRGGRDLVDGSVGARRRSGIFVNVIRDVESALNANASTSLKEEKFGLVDEMRTTLTVEGVEDEGKVEDDAVGGVDALLLTVG